MPQRPRPSLSSPTYGSMTGTINWNRGIGESLAQPTPFAYAPAPTPAPAPAPAPSPGTGRIGGCPSIYAWVIRRGWFGLRRKVRAGSIKAGDYLLLIDGRWGKVSYSATFPQPCRMIQTGKGALCCSESAPLRLVDGAVVEAADLKKGQWLQTMKGKATILANLILGMRDIQLITCENDFYWCRSDGFAWFAHHNMKRILDE